FDWIKLNPSGEGLHWGNGYGTRANPEPCLLAKRGEPLRLDEGVTRYEKYLLVDPEKRWQSSYENLLDPPAPLRQLEPFDDSAGHLLERDWHERLRACYRGSSARRQKPALPDAAARAGRRDG